MPKTTVGDVSKTKQRIPNVSSTPGMSPSVACFYHPIENRNIHEGRIVDPSFYESYQTERMFSNIRFECLYQINEPIIPRFILNFYSQVTVQIDPYGHLLISFMIQNQFITLTLAQFGQILRIPYNGQVVFSNEWDLSSLERNRPQDGPYYSEIPSPEDIRRLLELERGTISRKIKSKNVDIHANKILLKELSYDMKKWEELIRENAFGTGGHLDHVTASIAHMLYCVVAEENYNLAYLFVHRIMSAKTTPNANLPYGMFLTRLYRYVMEHYPHLQRDYYVQIHPTLNQLTLVRTRRSRSDKGKSRGPLFSMPRGSTSHQDNDDDEEEDTSRVSTTSPTTFVDNLPDLDYTDYQIPLPHECTDELLFTRQTSIINQQQQMHEEVRGGFKSVGKMFRKMMGKRKK